MKKSIFTTLALSAGLTLGGLAVNNDAKAADVDYSYLAQAAQNNSIELNQKPIKQGAYDYSFNDGKFAYHFWSDGVHFGYKYHALSLGEFDVSTNNSQMSNQHYQQDSYKNQSKNEHQYLSTKETPQNKASKTYTAKSYKDEDKTVNVNSHLQAIKYRESRGDYRAVNPSSGASGAYQIMDSTWSAFAPSQYKGMKASQAPKAVQDKVAQKIYNEAGPSQWVTS